MKRDTLLISKNVLWLLLLVVFPALVITAEAQQTQIPDEQVLWTANAKTNPVIKVEDMVRIQVRQIMNLQADLRGGIWGDVSSGGKVRVEMFLYDQNKTNGVGTFIYGFDVFSDSPKTNGVYDPFPWIVSTRQNFPSDPRFVKVFGAAYSSTNIKYGLVGAAGSLQCERVWKSLFSWKEECGYEDIPYQQLPVVVKVTIKNAMLERIKLPGVNVNMEYPGAFRGLPAEHGCFGKTTAECQTLNEVRTGDKNQVIVTSHRGYWGYGNVAEGSMASLRNGYDNGYVSIELDVQQSKDGELVLLHDQKVNRMISFKETKGQEFPTWDTGNQTDALVQAAWIQNLNYRTTTLGIPKADGGTWPFYPALKDGRMRDRRGQPTSDPVALLDEAIAYIQSGDKPVLLSLDIKEKEEDRYLDTFYKCLQKAKAAGCLHKIIFKPGSTIEVSAETLRNYLSVPSRNAWNDFAYKTNVVVIVVKNASKSQPGKYVPPAKAFIDGWINVPSVITFEYIYKYNDATKDVLLKALPEFGGKSVIAYTKERGIRTGAFWEIATDCRGVPSGTVNAWYSKTAPDQDLTSQHELVNLGVDARNNPEFTIAPPSYTSTDATANYPGVIVTDRPDLVQHILELHSRYNTKTKRP